MYPELERNKSNPDIKCPKCFQGFDVFTEESVKQEYEVECLNCGHKFKILQEVYLGYKIKSHE